MGYFLGCLSRKSQTPLTNHSLNFVSCRVRRLCINFVKQCLQQIVNYVGRLINSANVIHADTSLLVYGTLWLFAAVR